MSAANTEKAETADRRGRERERENERRAERQATDRASKPGKVAQEIVEASFVDAATRGTVEQTRGTGT